MGIVDAADPGVGGIHHHQLAMQAPEQIGAHAQQLGPRAEHLDLHAGRTEFRQVLRAEVR